jgi:hypothetical protein
MAKPLKHHVQFSVIQAHIVADRSGAKTRVVRSQRNLRHISYLGSASCPSDPPESGDELP